jgi:hypothetical protein
LRKAKFVIWREPTALLSGRFRDSKGGSGGRK